MVSGEIDATSIAELYSLDPVPPGVVNVIVADSENAGIGPSLTSTATLTLFALSANNVNVSPSTFSNVNDKS